MCFVEIIVAIPTKNPKGIPSQSPALREGSGALRWETRQKISNRNAVVASLLPP